MDLKNIKNEILAQLPETPSLNEWNVSLSIRGSISHNTFSPGKNSIDDIDLMGICIPPLEYYFGLKQFGSRGTLEIKQDKLDIVIFEWSKLLSMLSGCNPNVICLLWTPECFFIKKHPVWSKIIENRDLFLTKKIHHTFSNYAAGQLRRMERFEFNGYMGEKRKKLVEEFGYDTKNASHCLRLLTMAKEALVEKRINVYREEDAQYFVDLKHGAYPIDHVKKEAEKLFEDCLFALNKSELPENVEMDKINQFSVDVLKLYFDY